MHWYATGTGTYTAREPQQKIKSLPAGAYDLGFDMFGGPFASKVNLKEEELIHFTSGPNYQVINEMNNFWQKKELYQKLGVPHRRGILLYGPPGTGKSGILKLIAEDLIANDGIVLYDVDICNVESWLPILSKAEPDRKTLIIFEDIESLIRHDEHSFLQVLDGMTESRTNTVFLATTNYIGKIPSRILRPSRFDLLIKVDYPDRKVRYQYVKSLCERFEIEMREDIVEASEDMSFAAMKEMLTSILLYDTPIEEVKQRLLDHAAVIDS